jgi:hypothetical protein
MSEPVRKAELELARCESQLARAMAAGDEHEAENYRAAITLLQRQIALLRDEGAGAAEG